MADYVQLKHPLTERYVKLDRRTGVIVATKKTPGPWARIPILGGSWSVMWSERPITIPGLNA